MKQTIYENRQRGEELLANAIEIWQQSSRADQLEGLENDPVMSMLFSALAYQAAEYDSDIASLKSEVEEEFADTLIPYAESAAVPATAAIEAHLIDSVGEMKIDDSVSFRLGETPFTFMPVLETTVYNIESSSVVRIDGRRWRVSLDFKQPISSLSGFAFAIRNPHFRSLKVSIKGKVLPIIRPWQFSELPFTRSFSLDTTLYNKQKIYNPSSVCLDLFARQDIRLFVIRKFDYPEGTDAEHVDMTFEFNGLAQDFEFTKSELALNAIVLTNTSLNTATLSNEAPMVKVTGSSVSLANPQQRYFVHMLRPKFQQASDSRRVEVRRVATDRFDKHSLLRLLKALLKKYDSDYPAFADVEKRFGGDIMRQLRELLVKLHSGVAASDEITTGGVYLKLSSRNPHSLSLDVEYLTTAGSAVNDYLSEKSSFKGSEKFDNTHITLIGMPVPGFDEQQDSKEIEEQTRYLVVTNDRIVTPTDIKLFCHKELVVHYGIDQKLIKQIVVDRRINPDTSSVGYEIAVDIVLADNSFVRRNFAQRIPLTELLLEKMIAVRSANIYPVRITISIDKQ